MRERRQRTNPKFFISIAGRKNLREDLDSVLRKSNVDLETKRSMRYKR